MPTWLQCDFLLSECLDSVPHDVYAAFVRCVEFEYGVLVSASEEGVCETVNTRCLADTGHSGYDDVWHVAVLCDDFESIYGLLVADYIFKNLGPVLFDPRCIRFAQVGSPG